MSLVGRPLRFVGIVLTAWVAGRVAVLLPGAPAALRDVPAPVRRMLGLPERGRAGERVVLAPPESRPAASAVAARPAASSSPAPVPAHAHAHAHALDLAPDASPVYSRDERLILAGLMRPRRRRGGPTLGPGFDAAMAAGAAEQRAAATRWSGDGYLFLRGGGGRALGPGGQLAGGQAFARLAYRLDEAGRIAVTARLSTAVAVRQAEAAVGLTLTPIARAPLRVTIERRVAIDRGGRDAMAAFVAGGIDDRRLGPLRLDGYLQAGIVGARRRDGFVDGAARLGRAIGGMTLGAGAWGAAQPGAARLDIGPQAALRLPIGPAGVTLALDWRIRVAGRARPGNGLALTLAAGF